MLIFSYPCSYRLPIAWLTDNKRLFTISKDKTIKAFNPTSGFQDLNSWDGAFITPGNLDFMSITLSLDSSFIAACIGHFVSFWDTLTHAQLGIIKNKETIQSLAFKLSLGSDHLITGSLQSGRVIIWNLCDILPASNLQIHVSVRFFSLLAPLTHIQNSCMHAKSVFKLTLGCGMH